MQRNSRRQFLRRLTLTWSPLILAACGGGGRSGAAAADPAALTQTGSSTQSSNSSSNTDGDSSLPDSGNVPASSATDPQWIKGQPLNTWFAIAGTVNAGSAAAPKDDPLDPYASSNRRLAYSGMGLRDNEIILAANGGHGDYSGNEVTAIDLSQDAPTWVLRHAASATPAQNVAYYADGTPSSRHTYWSTIWNARHNRLMLHYSRFVYGSGVSFTNSNGFDLDTNSWDPQATWSAGYSAGCADSDGNCYAMGVDYFTLKKWTAATDTWSTVATYDTSINVNPVCYDTSRNHLFALAWGNGQGNTLDGVAMSISALRIAGSTRTYITFNPSAALTQFQNDGPIYSAMEYDPVNDQYLFYEGAATRTSRVYVIKPNASSVWDMQMMALGTGSIVPDAAVGAGVFSRFRYVAALRGFVLMSSGTSNLYFLRTA